MTKVYYPFVISLFLVTSRVYAWDMVASNVTSQSDIINVLRCIDANSPVDYRIGSSSKGVLSVHVNYNEVEKTEATTVFHNCYITYGNNRIISLELFENEDPLEIYYGLASELLHGYQEFSSIEYYLPIQDGRDCVMIT